MIDHDTISLASLLRSWHGHLGMSAGLTASADLVCLHIDRLVYGESGQIRKTHTALHFVDPVDVPILQTGIECFWHTYVMVAAFAHVGDTQGGHYQSLLRIRTSTPEREIRPG